MKKNISHHVYLISITAALAGLLFGIDTGVISGALPFITTTFKISTQTQEYIVSSVLLGAFIGTLLGSYLSEKLGRKFVLLIAGIIFAIGSLLSASATSATQLILYRIILGLSVGMAAFIAPIYLSEMAPRHFRGGIVTMYQVMVYTGILVAFLSDTYFSYTGNWRWMLGIIAIPAVLMAFFVLFLPRSPRWLIMQNKLAEANKVLHLICDDKNEIDTEMQEIEESATHGKGGFQLFLKNKYFRKIVGLGILLQIMQQFTGINLIFYYASKIFGLAGFHTTTQQMWVVVVLSIIDVIACVAAIFFVDNSGRKPLLYWGYLGMAISMFCLTIAFALGISGLAIKLIAVLSIVVFLVTFAFSSGPIVWVLCAEIFPLRGRDFGMAVATCTNWLANMVLALVFLSALNAFGNANTFLFFAVFNSICLLLIYFFIPETKDIALEHIETNLLAGKRLRELGTDIGKN